MFKLLVISFNKNENISNRVRWIEIISIFLFCDQSITLQDFFISTFSRRTYSIILVFDLQVDIQEWKKLRLIGVFRHTQSGITLTEITVRGPLLERFSDVEKSVEWNFRTFKTKLNSFCLSNCMMLDQQYHEMCGSFRYLACNQTS